MYETSARLLELLALLQARPAWSGTELAGRFDVSTRTVRNDIERLRSLGYPVDAVRGRAGHYRLGSGARMPPLLLDDDEAVAVVVGLRAATDIAGVEETSARALAKLNQVLPERLRGKVSALASTVSKATENTGSDAEDPVIDPEVLSSIATAVAASEWLRFEHDGAPRVVEPYRLVTWQRRWYLVARDLPAADWAVFRVDRLALRMPTHRPFAPRPLRGGDYASFVMREVASAGWAVHARITVFASADEVLSRIHSAVGVVEAIDAQHCVLVTGADSVATVAVYIGMLGLDFHVTEPPELVAELTEVAQRYLRAVGA
ncbi:MAG TPA: WYL domain-containing protein [Microbacterium sp.]|uniref:helix-turn-helix transcriptional regulator n=1 Tax=Microbacterium sp. TaxID=51671 RepID=UPI002C0DF81F|nr:WYL domain-containing protein [Microbacterium sp.]HWI31142.1 WYL domain-containing protein [Microbacterium sp.]